MAPHPFVSSPTDIARQELAAGDAAFREANRYRNRAIYQSSVAYTVQDGAGAVADLSRASSTGRGLPSGNGAESTGGRAAGFQDDPLNTRQHAWEAYAEAEHHYLNAASLQQSGVGRDPMEHPLETAARLPEPLRRELAMTVHDHRLAGPAARLGPGLSEDGDALDRVAAYVEALRDRLESAAPDLFSRHQLSVHRDR